MQSNVNNTEKNKYILLDWNVIKYLKNNRKDSDKECLEIIEKIKKKYEIPFCEAHLLDLAESNTEDNQEKVREDLNFLQQLSNGVAIGENQLHEIQFRHNCSTCALFDEIIQDKQTQNHSNIQPNDVPISIAKIDMQIIDSEHPLLDMLKKTNGTIGPGIFSNWLNELYERIFDENTDYNRIRRFIEKLVNELSSTPTSLNEVETCHWNFLTEHMTPFLNTLLIDNEEALSLLWKSCISKWLKMGYPNDVLFGHEITTAYTMLDFHPLFREKLKKKNTAGNIIRDSKIIYYASYAKFFITEDNACYKKAKFLFSSYNLDVKVLKMEEFRMKFS